MSRAERYLFATLAAEQVIRDRNITVLPVDPFAIARDLGIDVMAKPAMSAGVSGSLLRVGNSFAIAYATHISNTGFQRFSISHELGHYFLPGHIDAVFVDGDLHESRAGFASGNRYELEADHFAAALLMPRQLFIPATRNAGQGLDAIEDLHVLCDTSLTATAIRYAQCTADALAIVVSIGATIDYCFLSDTLMELDGLDWARKHQMVPRGTLTFVFNQEADNVLRCERKDGASDLQQWFGGSRNIEVNEEIVGLGTYGKTLTVLSGFEVPEPEDEEVEESLRDSWIPRFG